MWGSGCGVQGVRFRVWGSGCGVQGVEFRVWASGCGVQGIGLMVEDLEFRAESLRLRVSN